MSMSDPLADLLTRIRNGQHARKSKILAPASNLHKNVLNVLKNEGYIVDYSEHEVRKGISELSIELKYHGAGEPVIKVIKKVSTPGRRDYTQIANLGKFYNGLGISILSTSKGVLSDHEARQQNVGGEVLCQVY